MRKSADTPSRKAVWPTEGAPLGTNNMRRSNKSRRGAKRTSKYAATTATGFALQEKKKLGKGIWCPLFKIKSTVFLLHTSAVQYESNNTFEMFADKTMTIINENHP